MWKEFLLAQLNIDTIHAHTFDQEICGQIYYAKEYGTNYNAKLENILSAHCRPMRIDPHIGIMVKTSKPI
jgi:hypothetical protein